jgi:hypothetical protein
LVIRLIVHDIALVTGRKLVSFLEEVGGVIAGPTPAAGGMGLASKAMLAAAEGVSGESDTRSAAPAAMATDC